MHGLGGAPTGLAAILCLSFDHRAELAGLRAFKRALADQPFVTASVEVSGACDLILEAAFTDMADYRARLDALSEPLGRYVARIETSFVCATVDTSRQSDAYADPVFWVRCDGGHRRIAARDIDRVTAERDYVRLHVGEASWLYHARIHELADKLCPAPFIRLHRSALVRRDHIDRFVHHGRRWTARLVGGGEQPVSRGYVADMLRMIGDRSSISGAPSSISVRPVEKPVR
jgi:DNA-binding LytR/AlgR family response regulator